MFWWGHTNGQQRPENVCFCSHLCMHCWFVAVFTKLWYPPLQTTAHILKDRSGSSGPGAGPERSWPQCQGLRRSVNGSVILREMITMLCICMQLLTCFKLLKFALSKLHHTCQHSYYKPMIFTPLCDYYANRQLPGPLLCPKPTCGGVSGLHPAGHAGAEGNCPLVELSRDCYASNELSCCTL